MNIQTRITMKYMSAKKAQKKLQKIEKNLKQLIEAGQFPGAAEFYGVDPASLAKAIDGFIECGKGIVSIHGALSDMAASSSNDEITTFGPGDKDVPTFP